MNRTEFEKEYLTGINYLSFDDKFDKYIRDTSVGSNVDSLATMYATMARVNIQYHVWNFRQPEITALQKENKRLREALKEIADYGGSITGEDGQDMMMVAELALKEEEG